MSKYLTIRQLRRSSLGVDVSSIADDELDELIADAEQVVDAYCGYQADMGGHEYGPRFVQYAWDYTNRRVYLPSSPVPCQSVDRLRIQVSTQAGTGDPFVAQIHPQDIVVDNMEGWLEVVSLQALMYSMATPILNLGLNTVLALVDYHAGWYLIEPGERLRPDSALVTYQSKRGAWATSVSQGAGIVPLGPPPPAPVLSSTLQGTTTTIPPAQYTIDPVEGTVTFAGPRQPGETITANYTYTIPDPVKTATRWTVKAMLADRRANKAGLAGVNSVSLPGQISITRSLKESAEDYPPAAAKRSLEPYRHIAIGSGKPPKRDWAR